MKKIGFTLAEVLITLGIIGIVAAMTIPTLIAEQQKKQTVAKLQRALGIMNQAYRLAYDDVGEADRQEAFELGAPEYFNKFWAPYIKAAHLCTDTCGYKNGNPYINLQNKKVTAFGAGGNFRANFYTADGFLYIIYTKAQNSDGSFSAASTNMTLDINGAAPPNKLGKDVFILTRGTDGEKGGFVAFAGHEKTDKEINNDCKPKGNGMYCAEKIRRAGWKIDKSYPWKG